MDDLVPNKTKIYIAEGPNRGKFITYTSGAVLKLDGQAYSLHWNNKMNHWLARIFKESPPKKRKVPNKWKICFNCMWFDKNPGRKSKRKDKLLKLKDGKCSKTNEFPQVYSVDLCKHFTKRKWGLYQSKKTLSK